MNSTELNEILDSRLKLTPMTLSGDARWTVVTLSRGLPYYVHILGKYAALNAVYRERVRIVAENVDAAMDKFIVDSGQSFQDDYRTATESNQASNFLEEVLLACSLATTDESGFFTATDVLEPLDAILQRKNAHAHIKRHLLEFVSDRRGKILMRRGDARRYRYRFTDPMTQPYVIIRGIRNRKVPEQIRKKLSFSEQPFLPNVT